MPAQRWSTFVRNHAHAVLACDFFVTITVGFRVIYVFVVLEVGTRRIVHWNVTSHPTAEWTIPQVRTTITGEAAHRFLVHDRDAIYAPAVDPAVESIGLRVLKTPVRTPQANEPVEGSGISNRPIEEEQREQQNLPPRGENKEGAHASRREAELSAISSHAILES